jgi:uncharacterized lipoprotein YddW (UPF0748 family)
MQRSMKNQGEKQSAWRTPRRILARCGALRFLLRCCLILACLAGCWSGDQPVGAAGLRGAWVQAGSIRTQDRADAMLARLDAGGLNALFVNVLAYGHAYYDSKLLEKHPGVEPGYDPLAYVLDQAHRRGLAVHVWLVAGPVGYQNGPGPILAEHPEWAMVGPEGQQAFWLNYSRPDVRQFIVDLVLEIVHKYDVEGVHLDYTRYPGSKWGFDPYSANQFRREAAIDLDRLRYPGLPAYGTFRGNPLLWADTAQVLATFDGRQPAVLLNRYGAGEVILLNWDASERQVAAGSEILDRSIRYLLDEGGQVHLLWPEPRADGYGPEALEERIAWLRDLGWQPAVIDQQQVAGLDERGVLVLANVYRIASQTASDLAGFVRRGGGVVFVDGPTPSIWDKNIRALTGMRIRGRHFERTGLLVATQEHEIIPVGVHSVTLEEAQALDVQWKRFRMEGINRLLHDLYQQVKQERPEVAVSITVSGSQTRLAEEYLLDWQTWLDEGSVDLLIPRAYVSGDERLDPIVAGWKPVLRDSKIVMGLSTYSTREGDGTEKSPERVLQEIKLAQSAGSAGFVLFDLEHTGDPVLAALAASLSEETGATAP